MKCPPTSLGAPCETLWQLISWLKIRARAVLCPAQSCLTLCDPWTSVHGILQARILEWVAMPSSRASSRPRDRIHVFCVSCIISCVSCMAGRLFTTAPPGKPFFKEKSHAVNKLERQNQESGFSMAASACLFSDRLGSE